MADVLNICPVCEEKGTLRPELWVYDSWGKLIQVEYFRCTACGKDVVTPEQAVRNRRSYVEASNVYRDS